MIIKGGLTMLLSNAPRCRYDRPQLLEVICQLRFPTILSIGANEPAAFQDTIRDTFPKYTALTERPAPKIVGAGTAAPQLEQAKPITNYNFVSLDGRWKLNLTQSFIALSTTAYTGWEEFAARLDKPLAQFIALYQPAAFERIGLRYVNAFSRAALGLDGTPWRRLIAPEYCGVLGFEDVDEARVGKCASDIELDAGGCHLKLHAGPGVIRRGGKPDGKPRFIFDADVSMSGELPVNLAVGGLNTLHNCAWSALRGAISDELHEAMGPHEL